jgi:hypothetical protein
MIKAPEFPKSPFENSHMFSSVESPFTTAMLTIKKPPKLVDSLPNVNGRSEEPLKRNS